MKSCFMGPLCGFVGQYHLCIEGKLLKWKCKCLVIKMIISLTLQTSSRNVRHSPGLDTPGQVTRIPNTVRTSGVVPTGPGRGKYFQTIKIYILKGDMFVCLFVCLSVGCRWPAERLGRSRPNLA